MTIDDFFSLTLDIFFDFNLKKYFFLASKENFAANEENQSEIGYELFLDNTLISSKVLRFRGETIAIELESNKNYVLKKYDGDICSDNLSNVKNFNTDPENVCTTLHCE